MENFVKFLYSFFAVAITALVCAYFNSFGLSTFYPNLILPPFTPSNMVFPVAWSVLYALMVISFYMVLRAGDGTLVQRATLLFLGQLLLQMVWCYLFFYGAYFLFSLIIILLLIWTVFIMIKRFQEINTAAGNLQYPYLLWLLFAAYMNAGIVYLNGNQLNF